MFTNNNEKNFFLSHINPKDSVLEYGSGESTIEISELCCKIVSIEHQKEWYDKIKNQIRTNCILLFHPPDKNYIEGGPDCGSIEQFFSYVHSPLPYAPFDTILIDGRARLSCARICHKLVRSQDSLIFIHDWHRNEYKSALNYLTLIDVQDTMAKFKIK